jgi:hypothetical protein
MCRTAFFGPAFATLLGVLKFNSQSRMFGFWFGLPLQLFLRSV